MKKSKLPVVLLIVLLIIHFTSCLSVEKVALKVQTGNTTVEINAGSSASASNTSSKATPEQLNEINGFITKAQEAMDMNHLQEAVKLYLSALQRAERFGVQDKITEIQNILIKVGAKLTIEPGDIWKSTSEKPVTGNSFWAAQAKGIMPSVYLYENFGFGKSPLNDVAIRFEFIENDGTLVPSVFTDAQGFASTTISGLKDLKKSVRIRAFPVFTNEGYAYAFKNVYYDFVYVPSPFVVLVYTMEKAGPSIGVYVRNMEKISQLLKNIPLQPVVMQETTNQSAFMAALQGDLSRIAVPKNYTPDCYALFYIEIKEPYQYSASYKIFLCTGTVTVRIVSKDGTVLTSLVLTDIKGSGRDAASAIENCRNEIDAALEQRLAAEMQKLYKEIYKQ